MQTTVTLTLNGEARAFDGPMTVTALLATLGLETRKVAVERNEEIVPRSVYADTWLQSGDALEIVHFIGGGGRDGCITAARRPRGGCRPPLFLAPDRGHRAVQGPRGN